MKSGSRQKYREKLKIFLEFTENDCTLCSTLRGLNESRAKKKVYRAKCLHKKKNKIKNLERSHTVSLPTHLKALKHKEVNSPKRNRWQEIIKPRAKFNKIAKNQCNKELVLRENQQQQQQKKILTQTN